MTIPSNLQTDLTGLKTNSILKKKSVEFPLFLGASEIFVAGDPYAVKISQKQENFLRLRDATSWYFRGEPIIVTCCC